MRLNILVVIEKNSWVDTHIAASLEQMGHVVTRFYYGDHIAEYYGKKRYLEQATKNKQLVSTARKMLHDGGLDIIFCYVYDDFLLEDSARALQKLDIPLLNYNVDMACQWYRQIKTARYFTAILCAQPDNMKAMQRYASKTMYFPMAAPCAIDHGGSPFTPPFPVTFLGTAALYRRQIMAALSKAAIPVAVYGKDWAGIENVEPIVRNAEKTFNDLRYYAWPRFLAEGPMAMFKSLAQRMVKKEYDVMKLEDRSAQGFLPNENINALFKNSKINIGFTRILGENNILNGKCQMRLRDFEVPMAGGFYLVQKSSGYEQLFCADKEVVTWSSGNELIEKIQYYLDHEPERASIAQAGQQRAIKDHSWEKRFNDLFSELDVIKPI